jgi:hypothetical protein
MDLRRADNQSPLHSAFLNYGTYENPKWQEIKDPKLKNIEIIRNPNTNSIDDLHSYMHSNPYYLDSLTQSKINPDSLEEDSRNIQVK